jgi:exopolysaccharide production protein ExoQ
LGTPLALMICCVGIAGLCFLNRDKSAQTSPALWLPVIWLGIVGSRPFSSWFGIGGLGGNLDATLDGNPFDAAIYMTLMAIGVMVLFHRKKKTSALIGVSSPIVFYFAYCLLSVAWSPFHGPALKRWIKALGDLVMVFVVLTDGQPITALRRLYSRIGFILFPFSIVLIRYSPLGRAYTIDGGFENTGVTTNKNTLGLIVFLVMLGVLWNMRALLADKQVPSRGRRLVAQGILLVFGAALLQMAHCATAVVCFLLGGGLMLATTLRAIKKRPGRVLALCVLVVLSGGIAMLFGGQTVISNALGRGEGLSGRTYIWSAAIHAADNPVIGTGFESFWNANALAVNQSLHRAGFLDMSNLVSAHDGYLETYLDLGWIGVCLIASILISGYRSASNAFRRDPDLAGMLLAYVATGTFYNITEAGFRMLTASWIFLLLGVVGASGVAAGLFADPKLRTLSPLRATVSGNAAGPDIRRQTDPVYAANRIGSNIENSGPPLSPLRLWDAASRLATVGSDFSLSGGAACSAQRLPDKK